MANFARGGQDAKEAAREQASHGGFKKINYLRLADGESKVIRLIDDHDEWIWIHQHSMVPTKGAPEDYKPESGKSWPANMGAVCRKSQTRNGELVFPEYAGECFICDEMTNPKNKRGKYYPSIRVWARAVVRKEIKGTEAMIKSKDNPDGIEPWEVGQTVGLVDAEVEVEETDAEGKSTGSTRMEKDVVVLNFGMGNFFSKFQACAEAYGTVLDRDYRVTRDGEGLETDYHPIGMDKLYDNGVLFTLQDPKVREPYLKVVDLESIIEEQASDDYYDKFFDTRHPFPASKGSEEGGRAAEKKAPAQQHRPAPAPAPAPSYGSYDGDMAGAMVDDDYDQAPVSATARRMEEMRARLKEQAGSAPTS